jgi:transcription initiation factor TFIIIB Brf1 subunit/transcription initiation factor TFIIB
MYRASDERDNEEWLADLRAVAETLDLSEQARSRSIDLFLSTLPEQDRSKQAALAASVYVGGLIEGESRSQGSVADAAGVSRIAVQQRWKDLLEDAGLDAPEW